MLLLGSDSSWGSCHSLSEEGAGSPGCRARHGLAFAPDPLHGRPERAYVAALC